MLQLVFPNKIHKKMWEECIQNWENPTSPGFLFRGGTFEEFLQLLNQNLKQVDDFVPAHGFFLVDTEKYSKEIIGAVQIRHHINHPYLKEQGGHIGYGIAPKFRKQGYGRKILSLALQKIKELDLPIKKALITCDLENIGSAKIIESNGGIFERISENGERRYWVPIN